MARIEIDLSKRSWWSTLPGGSHALRVKATAPGYSDSDYSNTVYFTSPYLISVNATNIIPDVDNPVSFYAGETVTLLFTAEGSTYAMPLDTPVVTGASFIWTRVSDTQGTLVLSNPTSDVSITIVGGLRLEDPVQSVYGSMLTIETEDEGTETYTVQIYSGDTVVASRTIPISYPTVYSITKTVENGSVSDISEIAQDSHLALIVTQDEGYVLPDTVTVNGVAGTSGSIGVVWEYIKSEGKIRLSNPTSAVTVSVNCVVET